MTGAWAGAGSGAGIGFSAGTCGGAGASSVVGSCTTPPRSSPGPPSRANEEVEAAMQATANTNAKRRCMTVFLPLLAPRYAGNVVVRQQHNFVHIALIDATLRSSDSSFCPGDCSPEEPLSTVAARSLGKKWRGCEARLPVLALLCGAARGAGAFVVGGAENRSGVVSAERRVGMMPTMPRAAGRSNGPAVRGKIQDAPQGRATSAWLYQWSRD
jgi:hypothetical protein